jgi:REP element-mobilizing transposase RayT
MARGIRDTTPGLHHVTVGATSDEKYFLADTDRLTWIRRFIRTLRRFEWGCLAVCQLDTHVHVIVDTPDESISNGMHYLNSFYSTFVNDTYERRGVLVRSRYWSKPIVDDAQLIGTYRYVVRNPVRAGLCARSEDWPWSSFATACGLADAFPFVDAAPVLATLRSGDDARHTLLALSRDEGD